MPGDLRFSRSMLHAKVPLMSAAPTDSDFELLDALMDQIHSGEDAGELKRKLLAERPDLADAFECLEGLDHLASHAETLPASIPVITITELGGFHIETEIGRGGMGVVYKAWQRELGRPVALKMILAGELASGDHLERFRNETRALANVHHANIVSIYEAGQIEGRPYFAMQYVEGPTLSQRLKQGRMDPESAARLIASVAHAVGHLHGHGVIHRDIKPSNILIDGKGTPYVTDFGLAKILTGDSQHTASGAIVGTPCYMSPEQAGGKSKHVGPKSDVYGLGAVLYECLVGRPPFREETPLDTLVQVIEGEPEEPRSIDPSIPRDLELICMKCLEKSPDSRYESAEALADDLDRWLAGDPIEARPATPWNRLARWTRREPALVWRLVMLLVCAIIAQMSYMAGNNATIELHLEVLGLLAVWAGVSWVCQQFVRDPERPLVARFVWSAFDVVFFGALVWLDEAFDSPLMLGFPMLIAASGLWFRPRLVWFTATLTAIVYAVLWFTSPPGHRPGWNLHLIYFVGLFVMAILITHQVQRVRALSQHYERRRLG
jgi:serine/threonine protein kinase